MKYTFSILAISLSLLMVACKGDSKPANKPAEQAVTNSAPAAQGKVINHPSIENSLMQELMQKCTQIDYIFYNLPISISQTNPEAIKNNLNFVAPQGVTMIPAGCKTMGRKFVNAEGETIIEADMYLNPSIPGCSCYVFHKDGKPAYANKMTQAGINFYMNVFQQAGVKINGQ